MSAVTIAMQIANGRMNTALAALMAAANLFFCINATAMPTLSANKKLRNVSKIKSLFITSPIMLQGGRLFARATLSKKLIYIELIAKKVNRCDNITDEKVSSNHPIP